jgi:Amt family ammonium transporter
MWALGRQVTRRTKFDALTLCNGILIGCVSIAGVVDNTQNWCAVLIGTISSVFYVGAVLFLEFYRIDDPLEVFPVHCAGGIWGLFSTGFFDNDRGALFLYGSKQGAFMGYQIVGITAIAAWTSLLSFTAFLIMRKLHLLRVDKAVEEIGFDVVELGNVSEEFLDVVRDEIEKTDKKESAVYEKLACDDHHVDVAINN